MTDELSNVVEESARGGFNLITGAVTAAITYAISAILVARFLGPAEYGLYNLAIVMPQMLYYFTDIGISSGLIKFSTDLKLKNNYSCLTKLIKFSLLFRLLVGFIIFFITYLFADTIAISLFDRPELINLIQIASLSIFFQAIFNTIISTYVGLDKTELSAIITNIESISKASISILLVATGFGVTGAVIGHISGYAIGAIIGGLFLLFSLKSYPAKNRENINFLNIFKKMIKYGLPLYFSLLLVGFLPPLENFILGFFTSDTAVGNFKASVNFITVLNMITLQITSVLLPAFSKIKALNDQKIGDFFNYINKFVTVLIIPLVLLLIFYSEEIVGLLYGTTYVDAPIFLSVYCIAYFFVGFGYLTLDGLFNGLSKTKITLTKNFIIFLTILIISPFLTNLFGVLGLIVTILLARFLGTLYGISRANRIFKISFNNKNIIFIYLLGLISLLPLIVLRFIGIPALLQLAIGLFAFFIVFLSLTSISNVLTKSEVETLKKIVKKIRILNIIMKIIFFYIENVIKFKKYLVKNFF